jgi:hypothetical protein
MATITGTKVIIFLLENVPIVIWDYVHGELAVTFNEQIWPILKNLA